MTSYISGSSPPPLICHESAGVFLQPPEFNLGTIGEIPSFKLFENDKVFAFLDIQPLSRGHAVSVFFLPSGWIR